MHSQPTGAEPQNNLNIIAEKAEGGREKWTMHYGIYGRLRDSYPTARFILTMKRANFKY